MCGEHRIAGSNGAKGDCHRLRQSVRLAIRTHGAFGQAKQRGSFRCAEMELRFERDQIGSAHWPLLVGQHLEGIGAVIETVLPLDAAAEVYNPDLAEGGRVIEEDPEMPRAVNQSGQIDPVFLAVRPSDIECPGRPAGADRLIRGNLSSACISLELIPPRNQHPVVCRNPCQGFATVAYRDRSRNDLGIGDANLA